MINTIRHAAIRERIESAATVCGYLWERGWAERNGGNLSINLTAFAKDGDLPSQDGPTVSNGQIPHALAGGLFYFTGTGRRLRDVAEKPENHSCILKINDSADGYRIIWGGAGDPSFRPTSEIIPHLTIHQRLVETGSPRRAIVHTHATELLCLTHHPQLVRQPERLNSLLWRMLPEIRVFVPNGCAVIPYRLPGGQALADQSRAALETKNVVLWEKHGAVAAGEGPMEAFDYIDVLNKAATIVLKCMSAGFEPEG